MGVGIITFLLFVTVQLITCQKLITVYSDFNNNGDLDFFKNTFPWIIDNLGSDIKLKYHFKDSGKTSGPRNCVLLQLNKNAYLQAEYLRCEATGHQSTECIKYFPINTVKYNSCIKSTVNAFVKSAEREFKKIKSSTTPVFLLPRKKIVTDITPQGILQSICTLYLKIKPLGCIEPKPVPQNKSENETEKTIEDNKENVNKSTKEENINSKSDKNESDSKVINAKDNNQIDLNSETKESIAPKETTSSSNTNEDKNIIEEKEESSVKEAGKETEKKNINK